MNDDLFEKLRAEAEAADDVSGLLLLDVLTLPDNLRQFLSWMLRQKGPELREICEHLDQTKTTVLPFLDALIKKGYVEFVELDDAGYFRARTRPVSGIRQRRRSSDVDVWSILGDDPNQRNSG